MCIILTEQQPQALDMTHEDPPRVMDLSGSDAYVLIPAEEYERIREIVEDERQQRAIHAVSLRNAASRMDAEP